MARRRDATRESLLEAATGAFADKGFDGARVDAIARRARVNKAMIYYHFGTKQGLYEAVLLALLAEVRRRLDQVAARHSDPRERLLALYGAMAAAFAERPALPRVMLREILAGGRHMERRPALALGGVFELVRSTLEEGARAGVLRRADPIMVHLSAVGTLLLFAVSQPFRERLKSVKAIVAEPKRQAVVEHLERLLTQAVAVDAPGPVARS